MQQLIGSAALDILRRAILAASPKEMPQSRSKFSGEKLLPPFLGEMGLEVQFFIPLAETWIRSGWRAMSRRPELYPRGGALYDAQLFSELDEFIAQNKLRPMMCQLISGRPVPLRLGGGISDVGFEMALSSKLEEFDAAREHFSIEKKLKQIVGSYILNENRPMTMWDDFLTSLWGCNSLISRQALACCLKPSFLPPDFVEGESIFGPHVGVQLRNYGDPQRNSNIPFVMTKARSAAQLLGLPILVYGPISGTVRVPGCSDTLGLAHEEETLLSRELGELSQCKVMFAPDSGWADLMAWLGVPMVMEGIGNGTHERLAVHSPRLLALSHCTDFPKELLEMLDGRGGTPLLNPAEPIHEVYRPDGLQNPVFLV